MVLQENKSGILCRYRFTNSSAFENNEGSDKSSFVSLAQKKTKKFALQTKACSDLRTK